MKKPGQVRMTKRNAIKLREKEEARKAILREEVSFKMQQLKDMLQANVISRTDYEIWRRVYEEQLMN